MQFEIKSPELEALIACRLESGAAQSLEEELLIALGGSRHSQGRGKEGTQPKADRKSLAALFADSPFKGLDMSFDREQDTGRNLPL